MTNEQLKAFLAVAEQGSFRKGAKTIFKTQAAVSASIKALEERYEVVLFNRDEYRPSLTEAGQAFYHNARLTMDHFNRLDKIGQQLTKGIEPTFTIVVSIVFHLPPLLAKIKPIIDRFPNTQFKVYTESLNGVVERINNEEADLAFGPEMGLSLHHERFPVSQVTVINVAAPNYFNRPPEQLISLEEVADYDQIVTRDSAKQSEKASFYTTSNRESWSVNDFPTKKDLIVAGFGWGGLPEHLIERELQQGLLVPVNVEGIPVRSTGDLHMFRNRNAKHGPVAQQLWDKLSEVPQEPS
ncbi:LysR family transcriptional regulator [Vibrio sp. T187]|uniref:LysR family transcriptional regulator n=1 Tax=Vibrio TaxID=662 RepID=UPI0010C952FD|nr:MULTISPECIES: LysR family transcriptional regulator [Vibrio]MBW3695281.1 LysR family transcriptional regulator [Vibrio sp. T187]